jgi:hypothetical protein
LPVGVAALNLEQRPYEGLICPSCSRLHFINRNTGKLLGHEKE